MIQQRRLTSLVSVFVSSGLALVVVAVLISSNTPPEMAQAASGILCVAPGGTGCTAPCSATCYASVQAALDATTTGDEVRIAAGTYTGVEARRGVTQSAYLSRSVTLRGGYTTTNWITSQPLTQPTILDAQNQGRVVYIDNMITPTLDGLILQNGNALGQGGDPVIMGVDAGGGVYAYSTNPVITNCRIRNSTAGFGGGLAVYKSVLTLVNSTVTGNLAIQNVGGFTRGLGAGLFLFQSSGRIAGNLIANNTAGGIQPYDGGGGLYLDTSAPVLQGNTIASNTAAAAGGGIYLTASPARFEANVILGNGSLARGGGLAVFDSVNFTLTNNIVAQNYGAYPAGLFVGGSFPGLFSQGVLIHNTVADNPSSPTPWVIHIGNGPLMTATLALTNNIIGLPGGVYVDAGSSVLADTTFWDRTPFGAELVGPGTIISRTNLYGDAKYLGSAYRIGPHSPVIDQGVNAGVTTDIDGEMRPNGVMPDIGADEFYCYALAGVNITGPTTSLSGTAATFLAAVTPPTATQWITFSWQATGQSPFSRTISALSDTATFTWTATGAQPITITVDNCSGSTLASHVITIYHSRTFLPVVLRSG